MKKLRRFVKAAIFQVRKYLPPLSAGGWLFFAIPYVLMMAFVLSNGPEMQRAIFSGIGNNAPDIYSAAYKNSFPRFPDLIGWLGAALSGFYLALAAGVVLLSLDASNLKKVGISAGAWSALLLTLIDFLNDIYAGNYDLAEWGGNLAANVIGGGVIAFFVIIALTLFRLVTTALEDSNLTSKLAGTAVLVVFGVIVSTSSYLVMRDFFELLPARFSVTVSPDFSGAYWTQGSYRARLSHHDNEERPRFNFLPKRSTAGEVFIRSLDSPAQLTWNRAAISRKYQVTASFLENCSYKDVRDMELGSSAVMKNDVREIMVLADGSGHDELRVGFGSARQFNYEADAPSFYWVKRNENKNSINVTHFVSAENRLVVSSSEATTFFLGTRLFVAGDKEVKAKPRMITFHVDDERAAWTFYAAEEWDGEQVTSCGPLNADLTQDEILLAPGVVEVGILVTVTPAPRQEPVFYSNETEVVVAGASGWLSVLGLPVDDLPYEDGGSLSTLTVMQSPMELQIESQKESITSRDSLVLMGSMQAKFIEEGQLLVSGEANAIWKNSQRLSSTRWEKRPPEWQIALLSGILALIAAGVRWVLPRAGGLQMEDVRRWVA